MICDKIVDDNFTAIREIGKIAGQDEVLEFTLPRISKQIIDQKIDSIEIADEIITSIDNIDTETMIETKVMTVNVE